MTEEYQQRIKFAIQQLTETVYVGQDMRGGVPVFKGTRYPVSSLLAELTEGGTLKELSEDYDLDVDVIKKVVGSLSILLDIPWNASNREELKKNLEDFFSF